MPYQPTYFDPMGLYGDGSELDLGSLVSPHQQPSPANIAPPQDTNRAPDVLQAPQPQPIQNEPDDTDVSGQVKQAIAQKYGYPSGLDNDALSQAMTAQNNNELIANIGRAANQLGAGITRAPQVPGTPVFDQISKSANQPVQNILAQRKALEDEANLKQEQTMRDPNSIQSQIARKIAAASVKAAGMDPDMVDGMTAADLQPFGKLLSTTESIAARKQQAQYLQSFKAGQLQDKAKSDLIGKIESSKSRGAVKNAWEADRLVSNAQSIINEYPDLNQMPQPKVALLIAELDKVATGGAATEGGQKSLMPTSITSNFENALSKVKNQPTGANLGAFIQQYVPYLSSLKQNARNVISQSINANLVGYKNKMTPADIQEVKDTYSDYMTSPPAQIGGSRMVGSIAQPFSDPDKEARYQAWKKQQEPQ